jgi:hypothetical protein
MVVLQVYRIARGLVPRLATTAMTNICAAYARRYAHVVDVAVVLCGVIAGQCATRTIRVRESLSALQNSVIGLEGDARSTVKSKFFWWLLLVGRMGTAALMPSETEGVVLTDQHVLLMQSQLHDYRQVVCSRLEGRPVEISGAAVANAAVFEAVFATSLSLTSRTQQVTIQSRQFSLDLENEYTRLCATLPWHMYGIRNRIQCVVFHRCFVWYCGP